MRNLLAVLLFALSFVCFASGDAEKVNPAAPTSVDDLFKQAIKLGGFTQFCTERFWGCKTPEVLLTVFEDANVRGQFTFDQPTLVRVSIDHDKPGTLLWNETVIHEMVHYLQWMSGKYSPARPDICEMMFEIESQAYTAGHAYLKQHGILVNTEQFIGMLRMNYSMCKMAVGGNSVLRVN